MKVFRKTSVFVSVFVRHLFLFLFMTNIALYIQESQLPYIWLQLVAKDFDVIA